MEVTCQCGTTTFSTPEPEPLAIYLCHCTQCRKQSSSAFGISLIFPYFSIPPQPTLKDFTRTTIFGKLKHCWCCGDCGSRLMHWTEGGKTVSVKGGCVAAVTKEMMGKAVHIWTKEAIIEIPDGVEKYEEEPPDE